jgi:alkanesulfonate monooxygenase SsuD/methylene tetrahydromethanopterin reductase-like flavin-dependent oxidoreductase (luciferase family)
MEFGLNFFPSCGPDDKSAAQYWGEALHLVGLMDELGYGHVRTVEHHFHPYGGYSPNPIVFLAAASQRMKKGRVVTGAVLPAFNNPLKLAGEIGMLDAISGGRHEVGFARAFLPHEFERFGVSLDESRARFDEGVAVVRRLLEEENVSYEGRFHRFSNVTSLPRPTQRPRPPFWVAALTSMESFEAAGRNGYHIMGIPMTGGKMAELIGRYRTAWRAAGHPGRGRVMLSFSMHCDADGERARATFRPHLDAYLHALVDAAQGWLKGAKSKDYPGYDAMIAHLRDDSFENQVARGICWTGTPAEIADWIAGYDRAVGGFESASLHILPHRMPLAAAEASMRLFSEKVLPRFADRRAAAE